MHMQTPLQRENITITLSAQAIVCIAVAHIYFQRGSLPGPLLLLAPLLFSLLLWRLPTDSAWRASRYMIVQSLIAFLSLTQEFLFVYLFFVLSMQAMLFYKTRTGLIWNGVLFLLTLLGNFYLHPAGALAPVPRGMIVLGAFILVGILSGGLARVRRDQDRINALMTQLSEAYSRLQETTGQAEALAATEERNRLARELNDSLGHKLTVAIVQLESATLRLKTEQGQVAASLKIVHEQLTAGLDELRQTAGQI